MTNKALQILELPHQLSGSLSLVSAEGITLSAAAQRIKAEPSTVLRQCRAAVKKYGVGPLADRYPGAASILVTILDKGHKNGAAAAKGTPTRPPVSAAHPVAIDSKDFLPALQQRMCLALSYIDRFNLANAKLSEINNALKTMFDIAQIVQGRPTSISHNENMRALKDLVPALMKEAERRGMLRTKGDIIEVVDAPGAAQRGGRSEGRGSAREALGTSAHPPVGFDSGPVAPSGQSDFSDFISDL